LPQLANDFTLSRAIENGENPIRNAPESCKPRNLFRWFPL